MHTATTATVRITVDGQVQDVPEGISVAAAVLGHAHIGHTSTHPVDHSPASSPMSRWLGSRAT